MKIAANNEKETVMVKTNYKVVVPGCLLLLLGGCATVGPDYVKPKAQEPAEWVEKDLRISSQPADLARIFHKAGSILASYAVK